MWPLHARTSDSVFKQLPSKIANAPPPLFFVFGPGVARIPLFLLPSHEGMERREAPGSLRGSLHRPCDRPALHAELPGPK